MNDPKRPYDISYDIRPEYLRAFIMGDLSETVTKVKVWAEIIDRCRESGHARLMTVLDGPGNTSEIDAFDSSRQIVSLGLSGIKIAYVDLDPANHENNQFGELVAENRGAFAKVFTTEAEAHNWLIGPRR